MGWGRRRFGEGDRSADRASGARQEGNPRLQGTNSNPGNKGLNGEGRQDLNSPHRSLCRSTAHRQQQDDVASHAGVEEQPPCKSWDPGMHTQSPAVHAVTACNRRRACRPLPAARRAHARTHGHAPRQMAGEHAHAETTRGPPIATVRHPRRRPPRRLAPAREHPGTPHPAKLTFDSTPHRPKLEALSSSLSQPHPSTSGSTPPPRIGAPAPRPVPRRMWPPDRWRAVALAHCLLGVPPAVGSRSQGGSSLAGQGRARPALQEAGAGRGTAGLAASPTARPQLAAHGAPIRRISPPELIALIGLSRGPNATAGRLPVGRAVPALSSEPSPRPSASSIVFQIVRGLTRAVIGSPRARRPPPPPPTGTGRCSPALSRRPAPGRTTRVRTRRRRYLAINAARGEAKRADRRRGSARPRRARGAQPRCSNVPARPPSRARP